VKKTLLTNKARVIAPKTTNERLTKALIRNLLPGPVVGFSSGEVLSTSFLVTGRRVLASQLALIAESDALAWRSCELKYGELKRDGGALSKARESFFVVTVSL
jgi:hypothetical protein